MVDRYTRIPRDGPGGSDDVVRSTFFSAGKEGAIVDGLTAKHILTPLHHAREVGLDVFRQEERNWARRNFSPFLTGTEVLFRRTLTTRELGQEHADAALVGAFLGGAVLRELAKDDVLPLDTSETNLRTWKVPHRGFDYNGRVWPDAHFAKFNGADVMQAFIDISDPRSRTLCGLVIFAAALPRSQPTGQPDPA